MQQIRRPCPTPLGMNGPVQWNDVPGQRAVWKRVPTHPLLYIPRDPARELDKALKAAAIPKYTREGKVDFHALRLAYINFVLESGASVKEAQALARHATPAMTMNVYGRTRNERLVQTVERVGKMVSMEEKRAGSVPEPADTTAGDEGYTQVFQEVETGIRTMPKGGFEPPRRLGTTPSRWRVYQIPPLRQRDCIYRTSLKLPIIKSSDCLRELSIAFRSGPGRGK